MARSRPWAAGVALVAVVGLAAPACSSSSDDGSTTTTTVATSDRTVPKSFQVSTSEGEVSLSLDGQLPPGWPSSFPVPDGAEPAGSGSLATSDSGVQVGVFSTSEAAKDAFAFYSGDADLAPSNVKSTGVGSAFVGTLTLGGPWEGTVWVGGSEGTTYVVAVLTGGSGAGGTGTTASTASGSGS